MDIFAWRSTSYCTLSCYIRTTELLLPFTLDSKCTFILLKIKFKKRPESGFFTFLVSAVDIITTTDRHTLEISERVRIDLFCFLECEICYTKCVQERRKDFQSSGRNSSVVTSERRRRLERSVQYKAQRTATYAHEIKLVFLHND